MNHDILFLFVSSVSRSKITEDLDMDLETRPQKSHLHGGA